MFFDQLWRNFLRNYGILNFLENLEELVESHNLGYTLVEI